MRRWYADPTADRAIANIEREEKRRKREEERKAREESPDRERKK